MQQNTPREKAHAEIARQIRLAKRFAFKLSREGAPLEQAVLCFLDDAKERLSRITDQPPVVDFNATTTDEPPILTTEQLEAIADRIVRDCEYDDERIAPLVGLLGYLASASCASQTPVRAYSVHPTHVADIVSTVNRFIYGRISCDAARQFERQALRQLTQRFAGSEVQHA
jgi:hypothetical protein